MRIRRMTKRFRISLLFFGAAMLVYSLLRLGFYLVNRSYFLDAPAGDIPAAFIVGLRFDIAGILMLNLPAILLYNLPGNPHRFRIYRLVCFILFLVPNIYGILLNLVDDIYFPLVQRRLMFEPYTRVGDLVHLAPSAVTRYLPFTLLFLAISLLIGWGTVRLHRALDRRFRDRRLSWQIADFLLAALLVITGIRGGIQLKPIRQSNAFFSSSRAVGYLALNGTYTVLRSYFQPALPLYEFLPDAEAIRVTRGMLFEPGDSAISDEYPFLRTRPEGDSARRCNVVIFIMESWTADYIGSIAGGKSRTPFFDSLAAQGMLFTNFIANGQRSIEAVPSILVSIPGLFEHSLIGSKMEMNAFRGMGTILSEHGYETAFHHGGATGSMGFDGFARVAGFNRYFGREDFGALNDTTYDGAWGVYDEPFFLDALARMDRFSKPFCSVIFSLSSHDPYNIPPNRRARFERFQGETDFERSIRYADFSLAQFFHAARALPWFRNTIFVITADHTEMSLRNTIYAGFHIPALIYAPAIVPPGVNDHVGAQADILPTLLDLLRLPTRHASMGRSLLDTTRTRYAVVRSGPHLVLLTDSTMLMTRLENDAAFYRQRLPLPDCNADIAAVRREEVDRRLHELHSYLQAVTLTLARDRICPPRPRGN